MRPRDCDRRVLAALLPLAKHLGAQRRRLAHASELGGGRASLRRECCRRTYLRGVFLAGDEIASFLRHAGAGETLLRFETRRVSREMRGRTNASVSADTASLARAVAAARDQIEAVRALARSGRLTRLPAEVRAAAAARLRSPEATLAELAARLDTTRWVVRQRLGRVALEAAR